MRGRRALLNEHLHTLISLSGIVAPMRLCRMKSIGHVVLKMLVRKYRFLGAKFYYLAVLCRVEVKNGGAIPPLPHTSSWRGA
jgi:hypothetical protein